MKYILFHLFCVYLLGLEAAKYGRKPETTPKFATATLALDIDNWLARTKPNSNTIYSPVSLYNILASVYFGTGENSETRKELRKHFHFKPAFTTKKYANRLGDMTRNSALDTFNSYVFHQQNLKQSYHDELKMLNFKSVHYDSFVGKEGQLNKIVEKDTNNMIKDMFEPNSFSANTNLVLLNTILFMGKWDERFGEFSKYDTKHVNNWYMGTQEDSPGPFEAEFMKSEKRKLKAYSKDRINYISLRFEGTYDKPTWMTIVMPKAGAAVKPHEINFNEIEWNLFERRTANLILPKFEIENELDLVAFMKDKGAARLFSDETADLDRMFGPNSGIFVGKFKQKATIKVHEKGAEAAAATAIEFVMKSMPREPRTFDVKRPFKFFIHSLKSDKDIESKKDGDAYGKEQNGNLFFSGVVNCPMNNCN